MHPESQQNDKIQYYEIVAHDDESKKTQRVRLRNVPILIGTGQETHLTLHDEQIISSHLRVLVTSAGHVLLSNLGAAGSVKANQKEIPAYVPIHWKPGQMVTLGGVRLELRVVVVDSSAGHAAEQIQSVVITKEMSRMLDDPDTGDLASGDQDGGASMNEMSQDIDEQTNIFHHDDASRADSGRRGSESVGNVMSSEMDIDEGTHIFDDVEGDDLSSGVGVGGELPVDELDVANSSVLPVNSSHKVQSSADITDTPMESISPGAHERKKQTEDPAQGAQAPDRGYLHELFRDMLENDPDSFDTSDDLPWSELLEKSDTLALDEGAEPQLSSPESSGEFVPPDKKLMGLLFQEVLGNASISQDEPDLDSDDLPQSEKSTNATAKKDSDISVGNDFDVDGEFVPGLHSPAIPSRTKTFYRGELPEHVTKETLPKDWKYAGNLAVRVPESTLRIVPDQRVRFSLTMTNLDTTSLKVHFAVAGLPRMYTEMPTTVVIIQPEKYEVISFILQIPKGASPIPEQMMIRCYCEDNPGEALNFRVQLEYRALANLTGSIETIAGHSQQGAMLTLHNHTQSEFMTVLNWHTNTRNLVILLPQVQFTLPPGERTSVPIRFAYRIDSWFRPATLHYAISATQPHRASLDIPAVIKVPPRISISLVIAVFVAGFFLLVFLGFAISSF